MASTIEFEINGPIATLCLQQATMPPVFFQELRTVFNTIRSQPELRAVILKSCAKSFSYGLDLPAAFKEHGALFTGTGAQERMQLLALIDDMQDCLATVVNCPVPVIAAIHGHCLGGGIDLITCADIRIASSDSTFSVRETRVAMVADLGTLQRLPGIIGQAHTRELALRGCDIDAQRAATIGLVSHVEDSQEAVHQKALDIALEIAANPPMTVRGVKKVLNFGREHGAQAGLDYVSAWNAAFMASEDLSEAVSAFMQKRPPEFKGR